MDRVVRKDKRIGSSPVAALFTLSARKLILVAGILLGLEVQAGSYMLLPVDEVYDGDTLVTHVHPTKLPPPLNVLRIRVRGIDTPEMPAKSYPTSGKLGRAKCDKEALTALAARDAVAMLVRESESKKMKISNFEWGKYGGRVVADVTVNGYDLAEYLLAKGYAVRYTGGTKLHNWCKQ